MRRLLLFIILAIMAMYFFGSCDEQPKADPAIHFINMNCTIVEKIPTASGIVGNRTTKAFLIRSVKDTTLYNEYSTLDGFGMSDSMYYNHEVGDTLHFDYIRKNRFFKR